MTDYQLKYNRLEELVKKMLIAQGEYFKGKDSKKKIIWLSYQGRVKEMIEKKEEKTLFDIYQ